MSDGKMIETEAIWGKKILVSLYPVTVITGTDYRKEHLRQTTD
jgi:hypothetical protein